VVQVEVVAHQLHILVNFDGHAARGGHGHVLLPNGFDEANFPEPFL
jgi:hypothetical protein